MNKKTEDAIIRNFSNFWREMPIKSNNSNLNVKILPTF